MDEIRDILREQTDGIKKLTEIMGRDLTAQTARDNKLSGVLGIKNILDALVVAAIGALVFYVFTFQADIASMKAQLHSVNENTRRLSDKFELYSQEPRYNDGMAQQTVSNAITPLQERVVRLEIRLDRVEQSIDRGHYQPFNDAPSEDAKRKR